MANRVYKEKIYPIAVQISIQRAVVVQFENALAETQSLLDVATKHGDSSTMLLQANDLTAVLAIRQRDLAAAQQRLADLEAQAA